MTNLQLVAAEEAAVTVTPMVVYLVWLQHWQRWTRPWLTRKQGRRNCFRTGFQSKSSCQRSEHALACSDSL